MSSERLLELLAEQAPQPGTGFADDVLRAARRARRRVWAAAGASAAVVAVTALVVALGAHSTSQNARPVQPAAPSPSTSSRPSTSSGPATSVSPLSTLAAIYVAALRDRPHPETNDSKVIDILDHTCVNVMAANVGPCDAQPISNSVQREIADALAPGTAVRFVSAPSANGPQTITVTFGRIGYPTGGRNVANSPVNLPIEVSCGSLCAEGQQFLIADHAGTWVVTGHTSTTWIS